MSVTAASGFLACGLAAGLKRSGRSDLALVINPGPDYAAAGVFTSNRVKAAPVVWSEQVLTDGQLRAVILNSGGANACTGPDGLRRHASDRRAGGRCPSTGSGHSWVGAGHSWSAQGTAGSAQADIGAIDVAVCSTGLIGVRLPMDKIAAGHPRSCPLSAPGRRTGGGGGDHDHRHRAEAGELRPTRAGRSAAWPRARQCSRPGWPRCWW